MRCTFSFNNDDKLEEMYMGKTVLFMNKENIDFCRKSTYRQYSIIKHSAEKINLSDKAIIKFNSNLDWIVVQSALRFICQRNFGCYLNKEQYNYNK